MPRSTQELRALLERTHAAAEKRQKLNVLAGAGILMLIWIAVIILTEYQFYLSPAAKIFFLAALLVITGFSAWSSFHKIKGVSFIEFYRRFARSVEIPQLSYALDLEHSANANPRLVEAAVFSNLQQVDTHVLETELNRFLKESAPSRQLAFRSRFLLVLSVVVIFLGFSFSDSTLRVTQFWAAFEKPNPYSYTIEPGDITLEQGSSFSVTVHFSDEVPEDIQLMLKTDIEENYRSRAMDGNNGSFISIPVDLNNTISYYVEMDGYNSPVYRASVQLRPRFTELTARIVPRDYTQLDSAVFRYPFSQIQAYSGSQINLQGKANKKLSQLRLITGSDSLTLPTDSASSFQYTFTLEKADTLLFLLLDNNGLSNQNPFRFVLEPLPDEYPYVELLEPEASFEAIDPESIDLLFRASDDFGLTSARLYFELKRAFVEEPVLESIRLDRPANGVLQPFSWNVEELNLKPKDELTFWVEVSDNDEVNGSKTSRSQVITLTVPSLIDYFDDLGEQEEEVQTDLEDVSDSFEEMQQQYKEFKDQLIENPETNYEQQRQLQEVQQQQQEIENKIEELNKKFEQIKEELSEKNMLSEETLEAYNELKELMEEIDDPAFRDALEKLQENMSQMSPEQLRQALEEAEFNEELYQQRLERTLELFRQLKLNSDLEKLAQSYEDMARQEEELNSDSTTTDEAQEQRASSQEQIEQLKEQLEDLSENTSDKNRSSINELQERSEQELESIQEKIKELMKELSEQSGEQNSGGNSKENSERSGEQLEQQDQGQKTSQQIQQQFRQLAEETRSMQQQMQQQQMNINIAGLQYILYSLLNLSLEQEDLATYASTTENRSQAYVDYARNQKNVESIFITLSDSLFTLSTEIPQFSNQINEKKLEVERRLTNSLEQMAERNQGRASVATRQALGGINEISFMIANLLEQLQNSSNSGGGGGGSMNMQQMMEQMQQMGQDQQQLNQQIQDMINDMQGERLTRDQMERLNQISKQQNRIRQQLQEMQRNGTLESGDKLGSEMERMIEEMEETINDLRGGAVDPTLIERQQNILSRMLNAEEAMQERDEEERREGTTADEVVRPTPPELTLEELEKQIRNRLNDPNFTKYSADYQRLIEKYFELLKKLQQRDIQ